MKSSAKRAMDVQGYYAMQKNGPDVNPDDVELAHVASLEVSIAWGDNVLHVEHLTPPRAFTIGDQADFEASVESLGVAKLPVVVIDNGMPALVLPPGATGVFERTGAFPEKIEDLVWQGKAKPFASSEIPNARLLDLPAGSQATVRLAGSELVFRIASVCAGRPVPVEILSPTSGAAARFFAASFIAHAGFLGSMAFFMPGLGATDAEAMDDSQIMMMQKYLNAASERELARQEDQSSGAAGENANTPEARKGDDAKPGAGDPGKVGATTAANTAARYGVKKTSDADQALARQQAIADAADFGVISIIQAGSAAPVSEWGKELANGLDDKSANGNLFGSSIDDAFGYGGLTLDGNGHGGGGDGTGIGLHGDVGGLGHGGLPNGTCAGLHCGNGGTGPDGMGHDHGRPGGSHTPKVFVPRTPTMSTNGRIDPAVIQRIVRLNFGRFRACYEDGLRTNPNLAGRVEVKFVIGRDGAVMTSSDAGSDMPNQDVVQCVVRAFGPLSFPQPEGGTVGVTYPLVFSPSE